MPIYGTLVTSGIAMIIAVPVSFGIAVFLNEVCPSVLRGPLASAIELLAGIPSIIYGMWGLFVFVPFMSDRIEPWLTDNLGPLPVIGFLFDGPPLGIGMLTAGIILAVMVIPFVSSVMRDVFALVPPALARVGFRPWRDTLGGGTWRGRALHAYGGCRRHFSRPRPRARRNHGGDLCPRQRAPGQRLAAGARQLDRSGNRQ